MGTGAVSFFHTDMEMVVINGGMLIVRITRIKEKKLWGIRSGGQHTNRVSRGKINGSWKWIRGILVYFGGAGNIINGNGRDIQIWSNTINWKGIIEGVINCPIFLLYH